MKLYILCALSLSICGSAAFAESISLKHEETGKIYGPFEMVDGGTITLGKTTFTIVKSAGIEADLKSTIIPELNFRDAMLTDVISVLNTFVKKAHPEKHINFIVTSKDAELPTVTLSLARISALDVLKFVTELTGTQFAIKGKNVVISPVAPK